MAAKMKSLTPSVSSAKTLQSPSAQSNLLQRKQDSMRKAACLKQLSAKAEGPETSFLFLRQQESLDCLQVLSDSELIGIIHNQNKEAYVELFDRYQKKLFTYIYHLVGNREETEDILQNVFSKTYKNIEHFDVERKFSSWIYRIAHNESVNFLKRKSKRYTISWDDIATSRDKLDSASNEELPEDKMGHQEIVLEIDKAMEKIPAKYQEILNMRYFKEYSYEEMSKLLHKPVNTVGTLINRAKKKLLEVVEKEGKK